MAADTASPGASKTPYRMGGRRAGSEPLSRSEFGFCLTLPLLLFAAHLTFGAARVEAALFYSVLFGLFVALMMVQPWARKGLDQIGRARLPLAAAALTGLVLLWPLTPFVPDGPHPIWDYVESVPAGVIDRSAVLIELLKLGSLGCVFIAAATLAASRRRAQLMFKTILTGAGLYAAWACVAHLTDPNFIFGVPKPFPTARLTASFFSANTAGSLFGVLVVLAVARLLGDFRESAGSSIELAIRRAAWPATAAILCGAALLLSASRGAIAATAVSLALVLMIDVIRSPGRWRAGAALIGLALCIGAIPVFMRAGQLAADRYSAISDPLSARSALYEAHWAAFQSAPWTGFGLGSFETVNQMIMTASNSDALWSMFALHNVYLQWLLEGGLVGAVAMFATIALILTPIAVGAVGGRQTPVPIAVLGASLVLLLHGLTDFALQIFSMQAFWAALLGMGYGQVKARRR